MFIVWLYFSLGLLVLCHVLFFPVSLWMSLSLPLVSSIFSKACLVAMDFLSNIFYSLRISHMCAVYATLTTSSVPPGSCPPPHFPSQLQELFFSPLKYPLSLIGTDCMHMSAGPSTGARATCQHLHPKEKWLFFS